MHRVEKKTFFMIKNENRHDDDKGENKVFNAEFDKELLNIKQSACNSI